MELGSISIVLIYVHNVHNIIKKELNNKYIFLDYNHTNKHNKEFICFG